MASQYTKAAHMLLLNLKVAQSELEVRSPPESEENKDGM